MYLISPDIIAEAKGLSLGANSFFLFVGMMLWGFGWRWHRFWIVFGITIAAGLVGLQAGKAAGGGQVMAIGVLLAVSAGMLALELARIVAFITGGTAAWMASANLLPGIQELWVVFLCGGLLGVVLYRLWTMLATSFLGLLLCWHVLFVMAQQFAGVDAPKLAADHAGAITGALLIVTLLGVLVQSRTGRETVEAAGKDGNAEKPKPTKPDTSAASTAAPPGLIAKVWKFATS